MQSASSTHSHSRAFHWAGYALGFGIGGFFDGILLHQVLQWHHLLSGLEGSAFQDLRVQILADGLFHLLMYVVVAAGLWLLWRARADFAAPGADRLLFAHALIGFGAWHVLDAVASHWLLGIHRIRMDSPNPLAWDLLWFVVFGLAFLAAGWWLRSRAGGTGRPGGHAAAAVIVLVALGSGAGAALPPTGSTTAVMVLGPGAQPSRAMAALIAAGGRLVWTDASDTVWAVDLPESASRLALYRGGAVLVSGSAWLRGCLDYMRPG